jgi:membrane protein implicated in regulation of membrane protease activity
MIIIIIACAIVAIAVVLLARYVIVRRTTRRKEVWEGVVVSKDRSSPDGQNMYHYITVKLTSNVTKKVQIRGSLWKTLSEGDKVQKRVGDYDPIKVQ